MFETDNDDDAGQIGPWATDLEYVQDELAHVEVRCRRLALERRRDANPEERTSRRNSFSFDEVEKVEPHVLDRQIAEARLREDQLRRAIEARLAVHRSDGTFELGLDRLVRVHGLDDFERTALLLGCGPCVSKRFEKLYAGIDGERSQALSVDVVFAYLELSVAERISRRASLGPRGRLVRADLVEALFGGRTPTAKDLLGVEIELRARTFSQMLGDVGLGDELADIASIECPRVTFANVVLPAEVETKLLTVIEDRERAVAALTRWGMYGSIPYGRGATLLFQGAPGTGKSSTCDAIAHHLGLRCLRVDLPTFAAHQEAGRFVPALVRSATSERAIIVIEEAEALFASRRLGNDLLPILLTELERFEGIAILTTNLPGLLDDALDRRILLRVDFGMPDRGAREKIWRKLLADAPLAADVDLAALAERHVIAGGHLKNAALYAALRAVRESRDGRPPLVTQQMLEEAARDQCEGRRVTQADHDRVEREEASAPRRRGGRMGFGVR